MAFDGITIAGIVKELKGTLTDGRIYKIAQPEDDELLLTIKHRSGQKRLLISADASLPLIYLTEMNKPSPMTAPNFCMLLRKHLQNARIIDITQPGLERMIRFELEHLNELGDLCRKYLVVEIMGKHSNIIFLRDDNVIIDSIKHISGMVSSVREVLPGRDYFIPQTLEKSDPLTAVGEEPGNLAAEKPMPLFKAIYSTFTGISPVISQEICIRCGLDAQRPAQSLEPEEKKALSKSFLALMDQVKTGCFDPVIVYENGAPREYAAVDLTSYGEQDKKRMDSLCALLEHYYRERSQSVRIRQKSVDLRRIVQTALERNVKKYDLQMNQMKDTEKRDQYRIYGELLNTYGYGAPQGAKSIDALNYYTNETITIPMDPQLSAGENAKKYFDRYGKLKRTCEALAQLIQETGEEIAYLESVGNALDIAAAETDLIQIKEELVQSGYIRRRGSTKKEKHTNRPLHYISSDGFSMFVGKNNLQNDELTFQLAVGNDWWFHTKGIPGSHVIVKSQGAKLPDSTFEEAGRLAAFYSKARGQEKVEIDYTEKKNVKKPNGAKPGFVIYHTNFSLMISPDISNIQMAEPV